MPFNWSLHWIKDDKKGAMFAIGWSLIVRDCEMMGNGEGEEDLTRSNFGGDAVPPIPI
jgi:hypothetical protein